jgi:hypothetical protein
VVAGHRAKEGFDAEEISVHDWSYLAAPLAERDLSGHDTCNSPLNNNVIVRAGPRISLKI